MPRTSTQTGTAASRPRSLASATACPSTRATSHWFYRQGLTDPEFFEVAKTANIALSLVLLILLGSIFARHLPPHAAGNLLGIVAFGCFVYKAGYAQSELLFYVLLFVTFLGCWRLFGGAPDGRSAWVALLSGAGAGLAHLTKAAMLPFVAAVIVMLLARVAWTPTCARQAASGTARRARWLAAPAAIFAVAFLAVVAPYISTSHRVFGPYFYNVNSTFYVWYDDWVQASVGTRLHHDSLGWPTMPASELPGPARYWREHSLQQIGARLGGGFADIALTSSRTLGFLPYLLVCSSACLFAATTRRRAFWGLVHGHPWLVAFLVLYAGVYLPAIAFYHPTSGTGTGRFAAAHLAPLFFALMSLLSSHAMRQERWTIAGKEAGLEVVQVVITSMLALDVALRVWPRLMTTYGGF